MRKLPIVTAILAAGLWSAAHASTLFMGAYPNSVLVFDEDRGAVVQRIPMTTGLPFSMRLSADKTKIYVTTNDHSGIEIIDVPTRKVIKRFVLNDETTHYQFTGGTPDPAGKVLYSVITEIDKKIDHYEIGKPKFAVIDLDKGVIAKTYPIDKQDEDSFRAYGRRTEISPDGKYLYQFADKVTILDTATFKVVDRIELAKPDLPGFENVNFGSVLDSIAEPGQYISVFNAPDAYTHNNVFGVAKFDLKTRQYSFTPIGPSPAAMTGLQISPNKKDAYVVVSTGTFGNKRCEFWHFDLGTNVLKDKSEFACKTRFSFGMSGNGKKLYIYGASFEIEVYDAATLKYERTWDLQNDITGAGMVIIN